MTGIIRRIDHLGRVVVPKEMRKSLRIKDGDPLEIVKDGGGIVLRKYSPLENIVTVAESVAKSIYEITEKVCVITDTDKVIYAVGKAKELIGDSLSKKLTKALEERKSLILYSGGGSEVISITEENKIDYKSQIIVPIINGGDCYGAIIVIDSATNLEFNAKDLNLIRLGANLLSEQFGV